MKKAKSVEEYIEVHEKWTDALNVLRALINHTELEETLKWSVPTYALHGKNVLSIGAFKNHFGIWFFNGVFLKDEHAKLNNAQEHKTKAMRQWKFTDINEIDKNLVAAYIYEAIENQKAGKEIKPNRSKKETIIPPELNDALKKSKILEMAFQKLTPSKQREYCDHIESAKREPTKLSRLEKIKPLILQGTGLNDKYKNC